MKEFEAFEDTTWLVTKSVNQEGEFFGRELYLRGTETIPKEKELVSTYEGVVTCVVVPSLYKGSSCKSGVRGKEGQAWSFSKLESI